MRHPGENLDRREWAVERVAHGEAVAAIMQWHYSRVPTHVKGSA